MTSPIFALVFLLTLGLARLMTAEPILDLGDNIHRWYPILHWAHGSFPEFSPNHHILRWGVNIPATIAVALSQGTPFLTYLLSVGPFVLGLYVLFALSYRLSSPMTAALLLAWILVNPSMISLNSQLMPETYNFLYVALLMLALYKYVTRNSTLYFLLAVLAGFAGYGAKETAAFVMPGWFLWEVVQRRYRHAALLVGAFAACLLLEEIIVAALTHTPLSFGGRIGFLVHGEHIQHALAGKGQGGELGYIELFLRWLPLKQPTDTLSKATYLAFFAAAAGFTITHWRGLVHQSSAPGENETNIRRYVHLINLLGLSFAFMTAFFILSIVPLRLGQALLDRYIWMLLPLAGLSLAYVFDREIAPKLKLKLPGLGADKRSIGFAYASVLALAVLAGAGANVLYERAIADTHRGGRPAYGALTANAYFRDHVAVPFESGCEILFSDLRAGWTALALALPWNYFATPVAFYTRNFDDVTTKSGARVETKRVPAALYPEIAEHKSLRGGMVMSFRLVGAGGTCTDHVRYVGHGDLTIELAPRS